MAATRIELYDTTLRDGTQSEDIAFSVTDKLRVAAKLDELGIDFIEGGFPGSNPRDHEFFQRARGELKLGHARLVAFGATRRAGVRADDDPGLRALLEAGTETVTIFGKSWQRHAEMVLGVPDAEALEIVHSSVAFLAARAGAVVFDAEHYFDGYRLTPEFALAALRAAAQGGARFVVLCDTNGGGLPGQIADATRAAREVLGPGITLGVHCHNDGELAVANSLAGVGAGARHVQGTINGYGERCGNANLVSVAPNLMLKLGYDCLVEGALPRLSEVAHFVAEVANRTPDSHQPFVGGSAFAHKGGVHVAAVARAPDTYEHIAPELVGNHRRVLVSDLSGRANILYKAREYGLSLDEGDPAARARARGILEQLKELEARGYQFEGAEASFELLVRRGLGTAPRWFDLLSFRSLSESAQGQPYALSEATVRIAVGDRRTHTVAEAHGPVNALDAALRKALEPFYPTLAGVRLNDYKVRVLPSGAGTASMVRVLCESGDGSSAWGTVGVSESIIEASCKALLDAVEYKLMKDGIAPPDWGPAGAAPTS